jgi:PAS domain S-box-containing protein
MKLTSKYKKYIQNRLKVLRNVFAQAAVGDFSAPMKIPNKEDEFSELYIGVQVMQEVIQEQLKELKSLNESLEKRVNEKTQAFLEQKFILESVLESMGEGVVVVDKTGKFILFNEAAKKTVGYGPAELKPQEWAKYYGAFLPDRKTPLPLRKNPLYLAIKGRVSKNVDLFVKNPRVPRGAFISINCGPLKDSKGKIVGAVSVFKEITKRKIMEEKILEYALRLDHKTLEQSKEFSKNLKQLFKI